MHPSALEFGAHFFNTYCQGRSRIVIVDVGSQNVNGSLRDVCPPSVDYIGVDYVQGNGVDIVLEDPYKLPFDNGIIDVVVCSSTFEHSQFFWVLFLEILRVLKPEGLFYLNAPSNGYVHRYPVDCWRFYPDSGLALVAWAERNGYAPALLESFVGEKNCVSIDNDAWNDFVAVLVKDKQFQELYKGRVIKLLEKYANAYCDDGLTEAKASVFTDDFLIIGTKNLEIVSLNQVVAERNEQIASFNQTVLERDIQITSLNQAIAERNNQLANINQIVSERNSQVANHNHSVAERDKQLTDINQIVSKCGSKITSLNQAVAEREAHIAALNQVIAERDIHIAALNQAVSSRDSQVSLLAAENNAIKASKLWKLMKILA